MTQTNFGWRSSDTRCRDECISMLTNQEPDWNIDALIDTDIYAAIHYLEPDPRNAPEQDPNDQDQDIGVVICVCLYIAMSVSLAFLWFYWR